MHLIKSNEILKEYFAANQFCGHNRFFESASDVENILKELWWFLCNMKTANIEMYNKFCMLGNLPTKQQNRRN